MNWLNIENREFDGKKWEGVWWESIKSFILCGLNKKLQQNEKRKICFKNKNCDHLGREGQLSFSFL
jgi:hypothetical protein